LVFFSWVFLLWIFAGIWLDREGKHLEMVKRNLLTRSPVLLDGSSKQNQGVNEHGCVFFNAEMK
jgi:hypothetical protein